MMHNLIHRHGSFNMGDLGEELEEVEVIPLETPIETPVEPVKTPEVVPA